MSLGVKHNRYYTAKREGYVFDYVKQYLIDKYGLDTVRRGGLRVDTTIDLHLQKLARRALDGNLGAPDRAGAIVTIDPKTGYVRAMASSSRYGDSKYNLAAQGHRQAGSTFKVMVLMDALRRGVDPNRTSYVSRPLSARLAADGAGLRGPHLRPDLRRVDEPRHGDAEVRQHRLRAARRRPRPRHGGPDRARHGHHQPAARLPGRGPGRPDQRRLPAGDGARVRDDRQRRLPREADRGAQGHLPRRPRRRPRQADPPQGLRGRRDLRGHADPREERAGRHRDQGPDRLPGGGQDRHGRQLHRRLVRRLHAAPGQLGVGRPPEGPLSARPQRAGRRDRRADLGRVHEVGPGQVLRRLPQAEGAVLGPAVLRQVLAQRRQDGQGPAVGPDRQPGTTGQQGVAPGANGQGTGKGGTQYPPDAYSAPPQQAPNTQQPPATPPAATPPAADQGGTTAPTPG